MRGRQLQAGSSVVVVVTYNQEVSYSTTDNVLLSKEFLAKSPFATAGQRIDYVQVLQGTNDPVLEAVADSSPVTFADELAPTSAPVDGKPLEPEAGFPMAAIIGIACGGGAILIVAILFFIYCKSNNSKKDAPRGENPPQNVSIKEDEISTLAGPSIAGNPVGDRR